MALNSRLWRLSFTLMNGTKYPTNVLKVPAACLCTHHLSQPEQKPACPRWNCKRQPAAPCRNMSSVASYPSGIFSRVLQALGYPGKMKYKGKELQLAALRTYLCTLELVDHDIFFSELRLPDTFNSWFRITELHIWMVMVRLAPEGEEGKFLRNNIVKRLWDDVEKRIKKLGEVGGPSARREGMRLLGEQFRGALFAYDEGLVGDDRELAGTVWRIFFEMQVEDPERVEKLVHYVRKQICHLEKQDSGVLLSSGLLTFLPFNSEEEDRERTRQILQEITRRV